MSVELGFALLFLAIGVGLLVGAVRNVMGTRSTLAKSILTTGTVVANRERRDGDTVYVPEVSFTTADGHEASFVSQLGSRPAEFKVHDKVRVMYQPGQPRDASICTPRHLWFTAIALATVGVVFIGVGGILLALFTTA